MRRNPKKPIEMREVVLSTRSGRDGWELCATAEARYNAATSSLVIKLDSLVRPIHAVAGARGHSQPWLPAKLITRRRVPLAEARAVTREVFRQRSSCSAPARARRKSPPRCT
jgi:hypothetical protein